MSTSQDTPWPLAAADAAPSAQVRLLGGFLRTLVLDAAGVATQPDAFERLRAGLLQAVVVLDAFPADAVAASVRQLQLHDPPFLRTSFPRPFKAAFYGRNLNLADPLLRGYFEESAQFNAQLPQLALGDLGARVCTLLQALDGGRPHAAAPGPQAGQRYMATTLRSHQPGGFIPPHYDNEVRLRPSYRHLSGLVEEHILSFVLTLDPGQAGGALQVYDQRCEPTAARLLNDDHAPPLPDVAQLRSVSFRLPPGALIVLDSGRWLHRVSPVEGTRTRWTACSFMARARSGEATWLWG